jgi:hypothetical protein
MATVSYNGWSNLKPLAVWKERIARFSVMAALGGVACWWAFPAEKVAETGAVGSVVTVAASDAGNALRGAAVIRMCHEQLLAARQKLQTIPAMTACFQKQERIDGALQPVHVMDVKVRREPLAVYMKWQKPDEGQEALWRHGAYDGKILVSPAGWRRKVMPMVKIDPLGDVAMSASKRPVTNMGIWSFVERLLVFVEGDALQDSSIDAVQSEGSEIDGRPCSLFVFERSQPDVDATFQKTLIYFDRELSVPVAFELYRWINESGTPTPRLEESYLFRDLKLDVNHTDADYDHENSAYQFTAK